MGFVSGLNDRAAIVGETGVTEQVEVTLSAADLWRVYDFRIAACEADGGLRDVFDVSAATPARDADRGHAFRELPFRVADPDQPDGRAGAAAVANPVNRVHDIAGGAGPVTPVEVSAMGATSVSVGPAAGPTIRFDAFGNGLDGEMMQGSAVIGLTDGTRIDTPEGPQLVDTLRIGDLVTTRDRGDQPIRMIHSRRLDGAALRSDPALCPVRIGAGTLGFGLPRRDLWVSQQHRMLFAHIRIALMFGEDAVLVRAKALADELPGMVVDAERKAVTYHHLVFDAHEIIYAEGAPTESFHPGAEGIAALDGEARSELYRIFPELRLGAKREEADYLTLESWELLAAVA